MSERSLGNVVIAIKAIDEASSVMGKIQTSVGLLGGVVSQLGGGFAQVGTVMQGFAAGGPAGAVIAAAGEIAKSLQDDIEAAGKAQQVYQDLSIAVEKSGIAWDTVSEATKTALLHIQGITKYSDEEAAAALQKLMTFSIGYKDAMAALPAIIDFAAAKHMDLDAAAVLVGKAMDGNTAILKRYGVNLETTKDQAAELKLAHDAAAGAIKALGKGVDGWVVSVTTAIGADTVFENGLSAAKDKAAYLIEQFKAGNVDLPQFTTAMQSLGVQLDEAKMKGGSAEEVLSKLNAQFGGAAQAQAQTYLGIQERLKNATGELGEKIGGMLLPTLASLTEGCIPVVNGIGEVVDAYQSWAAEVEKTAPAWLLTSTYLNALSGYMQDLWKFIQDTFGPALQELGSAFKELWDALSPIGEAIQELMSAFGDTSGVDLFKGMLMVLVINIRAIAEIIKEVSPYIKNFAQAFRDAADFVTPILTQIVGAVRTFTDDLRLVFQAFYDWLIGGSLWTDLWNHVLAITSQMIGQLLADLSTKLFSPMQAAFTNALQQLQGLWNIGWQAIQTAFIGISNAISAGWTGFLNAMQGAASSFWFVLQGVTTVALWLLQGVFTSAMWAIQGTLSSTLGAMQGAVGLFWQVIQNATGIAFATLQGAFSMGMNAIQGILGGAITGMESLWTAFIGFMSQGLGQLQGILGTATASVTSTISTMQTATSTAVSQIQSTLSNAWNSITTGAQDLWNTLVGHSIWTDMLDEMQAQTASALGNIVGNFQNMSFAVPATVPYSLAPTSSPAASTPTARTAPSLAAPQSITIPITVTLDGQVITKTVKKILIEDRKYRDRSVGGY